MNNKDTGRPLLQWDRSLFQPAMDDAPDAVIVTTAELDRPGPTIVYVNPAFCRMTGYDQNELIGSTPRMLQGPETDVVMLRRLRETAERREPFMGATVNYRKDGTPYHVEWSITPVWDWRQHREYFVSIQRPVSQEEVQLQHLDAVLQSAALGFLLVDPTGRIVTANRQAEQLFAYTRSELVGLPVETLVPEEVREPHVAWREDFERVPEARPMGEGRELHGVRQGGERFRVEVGLSPVRTSGVQHTLVSIADVSAQHVAEQALQRLFEQQARLVAFADSALQKRGLEELSAVAAEIATDVFGWNRALVLELGASATQGRVTASSGAVSRTIGESVVLPEEVRSRVGIDNQGLGAATNFPFMVRDDGHALDLHDADGAWVYIPILDATHFLGFLCGAVTDCAWPTANDLQSLQMLGHLLGSAMRRDRDRRLVEKAGYLRQVAGRLAQLGGWSCDLADGHVEWSEEVAAMHETPGRHSVTLDEAIAFYAPECRERISELVEACINQGTPYDEEFEIITAKGRRRKVRTMGEAVANDQGVVTELRGAFQDVTEQRDLEQQLRDSHAYFQQLAEAMPGIVWTAEPNGRLDYANRRLVARTGLTDMDLRRDGLLSAVHPDDRERSKQVWRNALSNQQTDAVDLRLYDQSTDEYRWHYFSGEPVLDGDGRVRKWFGSALDVHDRKELEGELVRVSERVTRTLESITDGFYTVDFEWTVTYFNAEAERLLDRPRQSVLGHNLWEAFPAAADTSLEHECRQAIADQAARQFDYYYPPRAMWFEVHAYPAEDGLTVYFRDITKRKQAEAEVHFLAYFDPLTELPNRQLLLQRLSELIGGEENKETGSALLLIDINDFKSLNDTRGHYFGDQLLKAVGQRLRERSDRYALAARTGVDEFAVVLKELTGDQQRRQTTAERQGLEIRDRLSEPFVIESAEYLFSCSIGISLFQPGAARLDDVLKQADLALHRAKDVGRHSVRLFDPSLQASADRRAWVERGIPPALEAGAFAAHFQPVMDANGVCTGGEALVRWHDPEWGGISPGEFIPLAEEVGFIHAIGKAVLRQVCERLASWTAERGLGHLSASVNVSVRQFRNPRFVQDVEEILRKTGADANRLKLEVTESLLDEDIEQTMAQMNMLRRLGITFALDDFGTGYSSLAYLKRIPLKTLKIDQGFVRDMLEEESDRAIVQTVIALARSLGLEVLAEGVETEEVRDALVQEGCAAFQGYLFSPALPTDAFEAFAREHSG